MNVQYKQVFLVNWNRWPGDGNPPDKSDKCKPKLLEDAPNFPTTTIFDLETGNSPAISFYSRYHINLVIKPELKANIAAQTELVKKVTSKSRICCGGSSKGSCLGKEKKDTFRNCDAGDIEFENSRLDALKMTLKGWKHMESEEKTSKNQAVQSNRKISHWFESVNSLSQVIEKKQEGDSFVKDDETINSLANDIGIDLLEDQHYANLLPEELVEKAVPYAPVQKEFQFDQESIRNTMRVQFSGDSGMLTMSLSEDAMRSYEHQNCNIVAPLAVAGAAGLAAIPGVLLMGPLVALAAGALVFGPAIAGCNYGKFL